MDTGPEFVQLLTRHQRPLYGYIMTMMPHATEADDVLQETNLALMRKAADFEEGTNFLAWACRVAYYEALNQYRRRKREHQLMADESVLEDVAERAGQRAGEFDERLVALRSCLQRINPKHRELLDSFYGEELSIEHMSERHGRSNSGLRVTLHRIRATLMDCIQRTLTAQSP